MKHRLKFEAKALDLSDCTQAPADALVVLVADPFKPGDNELSLLLASALKAGDLELKPGRLLQLYQHPLFVARRVVLASVGAGSDRQVRQAVAAAVAAVKGKGVRRLLLSLNLLPARDNVAMARTCRHALLAAAEASYSYGTTRSKPEPATLEQVTLAVADAAAGKTGAEQAGALVRGVELAKEWGNRPANHATPTLLAQAARDLARGTAVRCEVLGPSQIQRLGMGSFLAVAQGSAQPARFIVLQYSGAAKAEAPVVLVGKGITFDTGGISLKPGAEMDEMKFDMCGAASVLGVFAALAELRPAVNVVGLIPACENMPDAGALKPGDVVTSMSGQTIEVLNTDAEGRLILCDALTYAERFKPRAVVDIATLTGACVIALGSVRSGLFASDDMLAQNLLAAGESALDLAWRLPLDDDYADGLKSNFADVANVAGRPGGAITAAKFLQRFASKYAWAHLDIAGTAWKSGSAKGATGRPVGLLVDFLLALGAPAAAGKAQKVKAQGKAPASAAAVAGSRRAAAG